MDICNSGNSGNGGGNGFQPPRDPSNSGGNGSEPPRGPNRSRAMSEEHATLHRELCLLTREVDKLHR